MNKYGLWKARQFLGWLVFLLLSAASQTQAANIAVIKSRSIKPYEAAYRGFKSVISGKIKEYDLQGDMGKGKEIIAEVVSQKPDLIYAIGTKAATLAMQNIDRLPVVFSMVSRPKKYGLNKNNIAGVSINISSETQFRALKTMLKDAKRIGVIYNPQSTKWEIEQAKLAAQKLGLELLTQVAHSREEVPNAVREIMDKIEVLWLAMDESILNQLSIKHIILSATRNKIPVLGFSPKFIKNGVLLALKTDYFDMGGQAGELALSILDKKGAADYKIIPPRKTTPVINLRVAKFLGLNIDPQLLGRGIVYE
jgi:putative ABC transport system substrate-binding protein